jgi:hypothetical protein
MTAPNTNDQQNQGNQESSDSLQELSNQENQPSAEPQNQQATSTAPTPRLYTEEEMRTVHDLYGQTLRENESRLQELLRQRNQPAQQQPQSQPQDDDFLSNGRAIIAEEIEKRLQPFGQFIQQQQAQTVYGQLKEQFKKHPNFSQFFAIPNAELTLDQQVAQMPPATVNVQSVAGLISQIFGFMTLNGQVQQNQGNFQQPINLPVNQPSNQSNPMPSNNPPHLRPSAPPMPSGGGQNLTPKGNSRRQLTELERRLARENRMSDDDYIDFLNEDPTRVAFSDIGQARK